MIDCFMVESPATSVAMAPNSVYLSTTHADELGVYLWYDDDDDNDVMDTHPDMIAVYAVIFEGHKFCRFHCSPPPPYC